MTDLNIDIDIDRVGNDERIAEHLRLFGSVCYGAPGRPKPAHPAHHLAVGTRSRVACTDCLAALGRERREQPGTSGTVTA